MRAIKFRIWHKQREKMMQVLDLVLDPVFGGVFVWGKSYIAHDTGDHEADKDFWKWCDIELMQCTGLHDKNGREIYEGDVLLVEGFDIGVVEYDKSCYRLRSSYYLTNCEDTSEALFEVIGNVHENPELVRQENND